jgi:hypothetical protein
MMPKLKGSHPWALILCRASDATIPAWPGRDYFSSLIGASPSGTGLHAWWQQISGGNLDFAGSRVFGWYVLPASVAQIGHMARGELVTAARAAATAAGVDLSFYRHTLAIATGSTKQGDGNVGSDVVLDIRATNGQAGWRRCAKCAGIAFWDGTRSPGFCLAGGRHDHNASRFYSIPQVSFPNGQFGWRWCSKCEALIFQTTTPADCPGGGKHSFTGSGPYVVRISAISTMNEQSNWRKCNKCQALAYSDGVNPGPCSAGGRHDHTGSGNYSIPYGWTASLGFLAHETGHGFGLGHSFGTSRRGDFVNDGHPGVYGDRTDIMSWANTAQMAQPLYTPSGPGLNAPTLHKLGWLSGSDIVTLNVPASVQSFTLRPLHGGVAGSGPRMLRVIDTQKGWIYTAEYRARLSWDQAIETPRVVVHAMRSFYQAGQDGWRWCANCQGLIYAGQSACPAGGVHDGRGGLDYWLPLNTGLGQSDWRWCSKCCGMFFAGNATQGACPAGGAHDGSQSGNYAVPLNGPGQSNWRWCNKCQGLAFAGSGWPGVCPAGGLHDHTGSGNYSLDSVPGTSRQNKWRSCTKCQGLYFAGLGKCTGGDIHTFSSEEDYGLVHDFSGAPGQPGWRFCRKCYGLMFYDASRPLGVCAAGGVHDYLTSAHISSGNYVIPHDSEAEAGQRQWRNCKKCSAIYYSGSGGLELCSAGGRHEPEWEYIFAYNTKAILGETFHRCRKCDVMVNGPAPCTAGGNHDTSIGANYVIRTDPASLVREQAYGRKCSKCRALFVLNSEDGTAENPCPAGGGHSPTGEYFQTMVTGYIDPYWRWCRKCEAMAYWDGSRAPGPCPAGGTHDHTGSGAYLPPSFGLDATQVVNDGLGINGSWANQNVKIEVVAIQPNSATIQVTSFAYQPPLTP